MIATSLFLAATALGIDTGWQPVEGGGLEYIIQIEPHLVPSLMEGDAVTSEIPPEVQGVRRYRVVVGSDKPPRIDATVSAAEPPPALDVEPATLEEEVENAPQTFLADPHSGAIADRVASYKQPSTPAPSEVARVEAQPQPWLPLTVALLGLAASLAGNVYLVWTWLDTRRHYRRLVSDRLAGS